MTQVCNVAEDLQGLLVPLDEIAEHPDNARVGDVDFVARSLEEHGQYRPAVVQKSTGQVCVGNHMLKAARSLGWTHLAAVRQDLTDAQARRLRLADNRAHDRGRYDEDKLLAELQALQAEALDGQQDLDADEIGVLQADALEAVGFDQLAFDGLAEAVRGRPRGAGAEPPDQFGDPEAGMTTDYECPSCGYEWSGLAKPNRPAGEQPEAGQPAPLEA